MTTIEQLVSELKSLRRAYVNLLEAGRDRILDLGGTCDPIDVMEARNPHLASAVKAIASGEAELKRDPVTRPDLTWRIKPKTIMLNGTELPKPVQSVGQYHISLSTTNADDDRCFWWDSSEDRDAVYNKLCEVLNG